MLNSNSTTFQIHLPIHPNYHILNTNKNSIKINRTIMIPINEEEENLIDNIDRKTLIFNRGNKSFSVTIKDIYCYGEVDFEDKDTLEKIENFNFLNYLGSTGFHIYSRYNYKEHLCTSNTKRPMWTETWSSAELAKFAHGYLGKPKRILLFNQNVK